MITVMEDLSIQRHLLAQLFIAQLEARTHDMIVEVNMYVREVRRSALNLEHFYDERGKMMNNQESHVKYVCPLAFKTSQFTDDLAKAIPGTRALAPANPRPSLNTL